VRALYIEIGIEIIAVCSEIHTKHINVHCMCVLVSLLDSCNSANVATPDVCAVHVLYTCY
jgi:hypothetical protein